MLQETKNFDLFDKICTQENVKCHIQHEESWLWWILYFLEEIVFGHFQSIFGKSNRMYSEKMKAKYMNEDVWKSFFR